MVSKVQTYFVLASLFCLPVKAENTIYWQTYHRPPGIMKFGEQEGRGFVQLVLNQIIQQMPEYAHEMPTTTLARALSDIKSGKNVCHPSLLVTDERLQFIQFSQPAIFNPTNRIILRKSLANELDLSSVNLPALLSNPELSFAFVKGRAFGGKIDTAIKAANLKEQAFWITSENLSTMFHLVRLGRIDVTIAYPFEVEYFFKHEYQQYDELAVLPVEDEAMYIVGSIGCPKTEWGRKIISRIDGILQDIKSTPEYKEAMTTWWRHESRSELFESQYNLHFLQ